MQINFKNKHIFFSVEGIWETLDYKFKYLLNQLVTANPDSEYVQTIEIPENVLIQIFSTVTVQPEGVSATINKEMQDVLLPQLNAASNLSESSNPEFVANEASRILLAIQEIKNAIQVTKEDKISRGKNLILS